MPVTGMEAEFNVVLDGVEIDPRAYWKDPTAFIDVPLLRRTRSSLQLPTGGAVYFDRGVIEVVTPVIELAPGSTARMVRNLWEQIQFVRDQLTRWEQRTGHHVRLKAYSAHYNVSFELKRHEQDEHRNIQKLALLLTYILPVPVAVIGTNRRSTGVGVRPREERIEVTADFTPDAALMIAAGSLIAGIVRRVTTWPASMLRAIDRPVPVIAGLTPMPHTSRRGWLARADRYPSNPFVCDIDDPMWPTTTGAIMSLRDIARATFDRFRLAIARFADPFSLRLIRSILSPHGASLLTLDDRPAEYEDVGRSSMLNGSAVGRHLARSRYERVLMCAVSGRPLRLDGALWTPVRVRGWSRVVFRRDSDGAQILVPLDSLVSRLDERERITIVR